MIKKSGIRNALGMLLLFAAGILQSHAQATLTISDFEIMPGESKTVTIDMTNSVPIRAFQVQVVFPTGVSMASRPTVVADRQGSYEDEFGELVDCIKTLGYNKLEDGSYMITVNADDAIPFSGTEGAVISFKVKAAADAPLGMASITLQDMELVYEDGVTYVRPESTVCQVKVYHIHTPGDDGVCTACGEALHLIINDNELECPDFEAEYETYAAVTYNRELKDYSYGFITLPFVPDEASRNNFKFYSLSSVSDDVVTFQETDILRANTPYLYSLREGATVTNSITGGLTVISTEAETVAVGTWEFVGALKNGSVDCTSDANDNYVFNPLQQTLHRVTKSLTVYPYTAYIRNVAATAPVSNARMRVFIDSPQGIKEISRDDIQGLPQGLFDLQGRTVSNPVKGKIYIKNGKKCINY